MDSAMDEQMTEQLEALPVSEPSIYEQLYRYLYDYHFARITFLELLDKWKAVLSLHQTQQENS
jgi:hypothetical protein